MPEKLRPGDRQVLDTVHANYGDIWLIVLANR